MTLTPLDIQNKEFRRGFRGYNEQEVDEFLDEVVRDFETLVKENATLKDRLERTEERLSQYVNMEETLKRALISAEEAAAGLRTSAQKEAEMVVREAREQADRLLADAEKGLEDTRRELEKARRDYRSFIARIKAELRAQLETLDSSAVSTVEAVAAAEAAAGDSK